MVRSKDSVVIVLLLLVISLNLFAKEKSFDKIDMTSGLSNNTALCLLEDHNGLLWIGTRDGLNKYDGTNFEIYKHIFGDSTSLINNQVISLLETDNLELWAGTASGLCKYNSETNQFSTFSLPTHLSNNNSLYIRNLHQSNDKKLWVGTTRGLFIIDEERQHTNFELVQPDTSNLANNVRKIYQDSKENIWIGTANGLYKQEGNSFKRYFFDKALESKSVVVREIKEDNNGLLWIGTENNGVYVLKFQHDSIKVEYQLNTENSNLPSNIVRKIVFENDENIWIGTFGGLSVYNPKTNKCSNYSAFNLKPGNLPNNSIQDIISDSMGGIWVAIYLGGVNYYHQQKNMFSHPFWYPKNNNEPNISVVSVLLEDNKNNLWIGTEGGGLYQSKDEGNTINEYIQLSSSQKSQNIIKSLALCENKLWIGTLEGLSSYHLSSKKISNYYHQPNNTNSLNAGHVMALLCENEEKIWVGTNGGGVQIFNPKTTTFKSIPELESQHIRCFYRDTENRIWVGCEETILIMDEASKKMIDLSDSIENWSSLNGIIFITQDSQNNFWIGTLGRGLYLIKNNKLFWFNTSNGLIDNTVNSLLEGDKNQLWITTNKGLSKIELKVNINEVPTISSQTYSVSQGVQGLQFQPNCALKSKSGKLFFGGINGLNAFKHHEIKEYDFFPRLIFTELRVNYKLVQPGEDNSPLSKSLNETSNLRLDYNQRDFSISFTGINFINPDKNIYRYKVIGIDDSWIEMGNESNINFTYFPVGTYEIRVQVSTNPNHWDSSYKTLSVTVLPPWWKTTWAFLIYGLFLIGLLVLFFAFSQRWAKMKNQLVMQQFQRDKENELHQLKLKFFTDVSHELRTPLTLILAPLENLISKTEVPNRIKNQLLQIQRSGYRLMQLVNQILDLRKLETGHEQLQVAEGNIIRFLAEISLAFKEVSLSKNILFEFIPHKKSHVVWFDRDKLEIIINNLLSNAFKFTPPGGKVLLELHEVNGSNLSNTTPALKLENAYLEISVTDSGEGIKQEDLKRIYKRFYSKNIKTNLSSGVGLELTKRMVELHKGEIGVRSLQDDKDGNRTVFSVYIPLNKNAYSPDELNLDFKTSEDSSLYTKEFLERETIMNVSEEEIEERQLVNNEDFERLLIVEDNPEVRRFIKELFADEYEISEAENGKIAFEKAIETNPQLIISDIMMPVMDGIELCKQIKTDVRTSHIPVILLTARTALTFKYEGLETGADDYITKPFSSKFLSLRVKNLIQQRKTIQEYFKREAICDPGSITLTSVDEKILKKAVDYITANIADSSINVNKISAHVGLSRVHFYRKIKALTNQTAVEFIRNIKLKRAATLLVQDKLSVKEVRNMVGFEDADYFRDCFKEQFGVPPSEYTSTKT